MTNAEYCVDPGGDREFTEWWDDMGTLVTLGAEWKVDCSGERSERADIPPTPIALVQM